MTFEEWWEKNKGPNSSFRSKDWAERAWYAALEQVKPVADILYVDYPCNGLDKNQGKAFWTIRNTSATVILNSENEAKSWSLKNGYRLK